MGPFNSNYLQLVGTEQRQQGVSERVGNLVRLDAAIEGVPRYFFHVFDESGFIEDEEGCELDGSPAARAHALKGARSIIMEDVRYGRADLRGRIEVVDADGKAVLILPFTEAVEVITDQAPRKPESSN